MNIEKVIQTIKVIVGIVGSAIASSLGGWDSAIHLLLWLIFADIVTGIVKAGIRGDIASRSLYIGAMRKLLILLSVLICNKIDVFIVDYTTVTPPISIRLFCILYFSLEELISMLENLVACGVKVPKFLQHALRQISDATDTTPTKIIDLIKNIKLGKVDSIFEDTTNNKEAGVDEKPPEA